MDSSRTIRTPPKSYSILVLSTSLLGILLAVDQLLLPMFHIGNMPFKISFAILMLWFCHWLHQLSTDQINLRRERDFSHFLLLFGVVFGLGVIGELWFAGTADLLDHTEVVRSFIIYMLYVLAFGLGQQSSQFKCSWLIKIFYTAVILNLIFIFLREHTPGWLVSIYYDERSVSHDPGFQSVHAIMALLRPRGLFGNPNVSALMVNVNVLFIYLALRNKLLTIQSHWVILSVILLPIFLSLLLGSRGEFLVSTTLGVLTYKMFYKTLHQQSRVYLIFCSVMVLVIVVIASSSIKQLEISRYTIDRISMLNKVGSENNHHDSEVNGSDRVLLFNKVGAYERFSQSPLWGTGFGIGPVYPFDHETEYFHNDWVRLLVTSGLIGFFAMIYLIRRFAWPLGWPVVLPFFLPGLVNSFMICFPASIFFWFMVGVLREKKLSLQS